ARAFAQALAQARALAAERSPASLAAAELAAAARAKARPELFRWLLSAPLSVDRIRELHLRVTRDQRTVMGLSAEGRPIYLPMPHGVFKDRPNNPRRPDGRVHEYCPPERVADEMDRLLVILEEAPDDPIVRAAWLHHGLSCVHPFADGNGRLARTLASAPLVAAGLPPLEVADEDREGRYLPALRAADAGDLGPFVGFIEAQVERAVALSLAALPCGGIDSASLDEALRQRALGRSLLAHSSRKVLLNTLHNAHQDLLLALGALTPSLELPAPTLQRAPAALAPACRARGLERPQEAAQVTLPGEGRALWCCLTPLGQPGLFALGGLVAVLEGEVCLGLSAPPLVWVPGDDAARLGAWLDEALAPLVELLDDPR
ncbi:Fic family protein, partial [Myxococcota bacterium]|nr:Fic family protein [Myxococcota bacterium]